MDYSWILHTILLIGVTMCALIRITKGINLEILIAVMTSNFFVITLLDLVMGDWTAHFVGVILGGGGRSIRTWDKVYEGLTSMLGIPMGGGIYMFCLFFAYTMFLSLVCFFMLKYFFAVKKYIYKKYIHQRILGNSKSDPKKELSDDSIPYEVGGTLKILFVIGVFVFLATTIIDFKSGNLFYVLTNALSNSLYLNWLVAVCLVWVLMGLVTASIYFAGYVLTTSEFEQKKEAKALQNIDAKRKAFFKKQNEMKKANRMKESAK